MIRKKNVGQEDLAPAIIKLKGDAAGISVAQSLAESGSPRTRADARRIVTYSKIAEAITARFEGFSAAPYLDTGNRWTIGFGHTEGVGPNTPPVTREHAMQVLADDLSQAGAQIDPLVKVPLTINQRAALIGFVRQMGVGVLKRSKLLETINAGHYALVPEPLRVWARAGAAWAGGAARGRDRALERA